MATYAAFKHVELYNVGKTKKRVLRPPGGGTSDIFGSETQAQTPRAVKNHMQSNIFGNNDQRNVKNNVLQGIHRFYFIGDSVRRSQKNVDSYSRLFGEPERPFTPAKNHMKSNIPIGPTAAAAAAAAASESKETNGSSSSSSLSSSSTAASAAHPVANNYQNRNRIENGGSDHQNGVSKTVYRKILYGVTDTADSVSSQNSTPRYNKGVINSNFDQNQQNNEKMSTKINNNNILSSPPPSKNNNYNDNNYNNTNNNNMNMNGVSSNKMTNNVNDNITKDSSIIMNGNNNHHNENESSGNGSNTNSSLISPASTATTNTSSSSASKYGGRYSSKYMTRNPVTGYGIEEPAQRQRRTLRRDGNPVTGEGYKPAGAEINTSVPALNGANQVIIKNRIPPGGYSSGLW